MTSNFWLVTTASVHISRTMKMTCLGLGQSGVTNLCFSFLFFYLLDVLSSRINSMKVKFCEMLKSFSRLHSEFMFSGRLIIS